MTDEQPETATLREAAKLMADAEARLTDACKKLKDDDKAEVQLFAEEAADVRVRVRALADRLTP